MDTFTTHVGESVSSSREGIQGLKVEQLKWSAGAVNSWPGSGIRERDSLIVDKGYTMSVIRLISSVSESSEPEELRETKMNFC